MTRWMCGVSLNERQLSNERRRRLGVEAIGDVVRRDRVRWHGQVRKDDADYVRHAAGRWRKGWFLLAGRGTPGRKLCLPT